MLASENFTIPVDTENDSTLRFRPLSDSDNYALAPIESTPIPFNPQRTQRRFTNNLGKATVLPKGVKF